MRVSKGISDDIHLLGFKRVDLSAVTYFDVVYLGCNMEIRIGTTPYDTSNGLDILCTHWCIGRFV